MAAQPFQSGEWDGSARNEPVETKHAQKIARLLQGSELRPQKILNIMKSGVTDIWIPVRQAIFIEMTGPQECHDFLGLQPQLLANTFAVSPEDQWPSEHVNLEPRAVNELGLPRSLEFVAKIGDGGHDTSVFEVKPKNSSGVTYALKRINRENTRAREMERMKYIQGELDALKKIRHRHFIKMVGSYTTPRFVGILMNPLAECNLYEFLSRPDRYEERNYERLLAGFFGCLTTALAQLHYTYRIRHKDIKPQNILVKGDNVLLADFGIALDWSDRGYTTTQEETLRSPRYCAPEVGRNDKRGTMSDIWSLGCVFLEMTAVLKGHRSGHVKESLINHGGTDKYWQSLDGISREISFLRQDSSRCGNAPLDWVEKMLREKQEERCTAGELRSLIHESRGQPGPYFCGACCSHGTVADEDEEASTDLREYQPLQK
ncbi:hypothetical protein DL770_010577 [Monosporascus sp. CRB-9-2]|nr:hypothetical protein DL770_010577 [Monosporascus sp. CRB-9-2]